MSTDSLSAHERVHALYCDHHGWLFGWLRRRTANAADAADVAHDTFVRILASRDLLLSIREPRAYLTTAAQRLLTDRFRRQLLEQAYLAELANAVEMLPTAPSPEEIAMAVQVLLQIDGALDGAPPKVREAFLRHYLEAQTHAQIALDLGVSTRMVRKYLVQALLRCHAHCPALAGLNA